MVPPRMTRRVDTQNALKKLPSARICAYEEMLKLIGMNTTRPAAALVLSLKEMASAFRMGMMQVNAIRDRTRIMIRSYSVNFFMKLLLPLGLAENQLAG